MSQSLNPFSAPAADLPLFPSSTSPTSASTSGVGLGYGIAIAVGILVLISTIMLASYLCVRIKSYSAYGGTHHRHPTAVPSPPLHAGPTVVVVGLDRAAIDAFYPKLAYGRGGGSVGSAECAICLAEYAEGDPMRRVPECGHCFHAACLDQWLRTSATCPVCRSSPLPTPLATPLSELIPLAFHPSGRAIGYLIEVDL